MSENKKYCCPTCRRMVPISKEICPFCRTDNTDMIEKMSSSDKKKYSDSKSSKCSDDEYEEYNPEYEEYENYVPDMQELEQHDIEMFVDDDDNDNDDDDDDELEEDNEDIDNFIYEELNNEEYDDYDINNANDLQNASSNREKIKWTDEKLKEKPDYTKMYDKDGKYNANYDGYYDDVLPRISNEVDHILAGKEKAILKVIFSIVAIFGIILYLVLTL